MIDNLDLADWHSLRTKAIGILQTMNEDQPQWTDYNTHDPGITLLESLCYAISDLAYRLDFPIEDLLALNTSTLTNGAGKTSSVFFAPEQVLPTLPVTLSDYVQWCLKQQGIIGAWLKFSQAGTYQVFLGVTKSVASQGQADPSKRILQQFNNWRNICEKFARVDLLPNKAITIKGEIILTSNANPNIVQHAVQQAIKEFLTQSIALSIESATQSQTLCGVEISEDITDDFPVIKVDKAVLLQKLKKISGIKQIPEFRLTTEQTYIDQQLLVITKAIPIISDNSELTFNHFGQKKSMSLPEIIPSSQIQEDDNSSNIEYTQGTYRHLATYETLQNVLPDYYGVGAAGLCGLYFSESNYKDMNLSETGKENESADDLRRYLILFDQLLNDYFAQLDGFKQTFSLADQDSSIKGFHSQLLPKDAGYDLVKDKDVVDDTDYIEEMFRLDQQQQNKVLNYLLAQHGETYMPFDIFKSFSELDVSASGNTTDVEKLKYYLSRKKLFLKEIVTLRGQRGQVQALQKILCLRLALPNNQLQLIDNIMLKPPEIGRPIDQGGFRIGSSTPKHTAFKIDSGETDFCVVLLPQKLEKVSSIAYLERILAEEIPAHLVYHVIFDDSTFGEDQSATEIILKQRDIALSRMKIED